MNIILIIALVIAGAAAIWLFIGDKVRADMDKEISVAADAIPGVTREEAIAKAAAEAAAAEVKIAQEVERRALVEEQASIVRQLEGRLRDLEMAAIIAPLDPAIIKETEEVEARAAVERAELELRWKDALGRAEVAMVRAEEAAIVATGAYATAWAKVVYWTNQLAKNRRQNEVLLQIRANIAPEDLTLVLAKSFEAQALTLFENMERYKRELELARNRAATVRTEVVSAINSANLTIERVLTIIADIRLLGILLALAGRVDGIAKAIRTKLAELEARLG